MHLFIASKCRIFRPAAMNSSDNRCDITSFSIMVYGETGMFFMCCSLELTIAPVTSLSREPVDSERSFLFTYSKPMFYIPLVMTISSIICHVKFYRVAKIKRPNSEEKHIIS